MTTHAILKDKKVTLCSWEEWTEWMKPTFTLEAPSLETAKKEFIEKRCVARDEPRSGVHVSTVFLGINHGWNNIPLWFETMIFGGDHDGYQERYQTWEQAEAGHSRAVDLVKASQS